MKLRRDAFLYLDPVKPKSRFAQCGTCRDFMPKAHRCAIMNAKVDADDSCGLYVHGKPRDDQRARVLVSPEQAGLVRREVRCENCMFFDGKQTCGLFERLNRDEPERFDLDTEVDPFGCCNAQTPRNGRERHAGGGQVGMADGGEPADAAPDAGPPAFDPSKPFTPAPASPPPFDPSKPFTPAPAAPPRDTGLLAAPFAGMLRGIRETGQTAEAIGGGKPEPLPEENIIASQPMTWSDLAHPVTTAEKIFYGLGRSGPSWVGGFLGATAATAIPGVGEAGGVGQLVGGALGAAAGSMAQSIGPKFAAALKADPKNPDAAFNQAVKDSAIEGGVSGVAWAAFPYAPAAFQGAFKHLLFQAFSVQPGISAAGTALENVVAGRPAGENVAESIPGAIIGTAAPLAGHAAVRYAAGRLLGRQAPEGPPPAVTHEGAAVVPAGAPPIGAMVGFGMPGQPAERLTVMGYEDNGRGVRVQHEDGSSSLMASADLAQNSVAAAPAPETPRAPPMRQEGQPATMADIDRNAAPLEDEMTGPVLPSTAAHAVGQTQAGAAARVRAGEAAAAQPMLDPIAQRALDVADMHDRRALQFLQAGNTDAAQAESSAASVLRQRYGAAPGGGFSPADQAAAAAARQQAAQPEIMGQRVPPIAEPNLGPEQTADMEALARAARAAAATTPEVRPAVATPEPQQTLGEQLAGQVVRPAAAPAAAPTAEPQPAPAVPPEAPQAAAAPAAIGARPLRDQVEPAFIPSTGAEFPVQYAIVDAHDLVTSNHDDLSPNGAYPQALQPRHRERAETEAQIRSILNGGTEGAFRPELLGETADAANGAPIVGADGLVEGGNARTMALRRAYDQGMPQAAQYRAWLASQGYPVEGVAAPMLVRINRADMAMPQREQLARDLNVPAVAAMSATEQAMGDAQQIPAEALRGYQGGDVFAAGNTPYLMSLLRSFVRPTDLPAMTNPEGGLSQAGRRRVQGALLAKAYGDPGIVAALTEDPDSNIKAIGNALTDAAPAWGQLRDAVASGHVPEAYDLTTHLLDAVRLIAHARDSGRNIAEFVNQRGMFGEGVTPEAESILSWMLGAPDWTRRYGRDKIADALTEYASAAQRVPGLLGEAPATPLQLTEEARERAQGAVGDLFAQAVGQSGGPAAVRPVAGEGRPEAQGPWPVEAGVGEPAGGAPEREPEAAEPRVEPAAAAAEPQAQAPEAAPSEAPEVPTPAAEEVVGPKIIDTHHTKTGAAISVVQLPERVGSDEFKALGKEARALGGYYSSFRGKGAVPGFVFKTREAADRFADIARGASAEEEAPAAAPTEAPRWMRENTSEGRRQLAVAAGYPPQEALRVSRMGWPALERDPETVARLEDAWQRGAVPELGPAPTEEAAPAAAPEAPPPQAEKPRAPGWEEIGKNHIGQTIYEDQRGVRSYIEGGVRHTEPVEVRPVRGPQTEPWAHIGVKAPGDKAPEYQVAEPHPAVPGQAVEYRPEAPQAAVSPDAMAAKLFETYETGGAQAARDLWAKMPPMTIQRRAVLGDRLRALIEASGRSWADFQKEVGPGERGEVPEPGAPPEVPGALAATPSWEERGKAPHLALSEMIARALEQPEPISSRELQGYAEHAFGSRLAEGKFTRADMYDALELGVNRLIRERGAEMSPNEGLPEAQATVTKLEELKNRLPTQTVRAGEKETHQQFSTPPDYAYAAVRAAAIRPTDRVLEPSAGTGSLVSHAMNAGPAEMTVNELSAHRAALVESLGPNRSFRENAEQLNNILPADVRPTVVVMNPPFSATAGRMGDKMVAETAARHIEQALARLDPGGRLVAIVGRGMRAYDPAAPVRVREGTGAAFRDWWRKIGAQYDVRANIGVPGDVYTKYGTAFGTQLLVIDKAPPSGRPLVGGDVNDIHGLIDRLEGIRNERPPILETAAGTPAGEQLAAEPSRAEVAPGSEGGGERRPPLPGATRGPGVRGEPGGPRPGERPPGGPDVGGGAAVRPEAGSGEPDAMVHGEPERPGPSGAEPRPVEPTPEVDQLAGSGAEPDGNILRPNLGGERPISPAESDARIEQPAPAPKVQVDEIAADPIVGGAVTEEVYEPYKPQRISIRGAKAHPGELVQSAAMASVMPPRVDYAPRFSEDFIKSGVLSAAQLESVVYAGNAHSQMLPAHEGETAYRRGWFLGDGTGVGKGRQIAGIIADNMAQGRRKAIWISASRALLEDARRDWSGIGEDPKRVFDVGTVKPGDPIKTSDGIGFLTYTGLKSGERAEGGKRRLDQLVDWLGPDYDGPVIFDEAHKMGNAIDQLGGRGVKKASQQALAGIELQKKLPNARIVYVSATGATEISNLAYAERLGLWGRGTPFATKQDFISQMSNGGVAAMELVARDLKALGSYTARNLSYRGVDYDRVEHVLSPDQREVYDKLAGAWQVVLRHINEALAGTGADKNPRAKSAAMSAFWGSHQRFFNQIVTSLQMPSVIRGAERDIAEGRQAVLQLVNTSEASQQRAIAKRRTAEGAEADLEDLDITPKDQLIQLIDKSFPTQEYEEYQDEDGNTRTRPVVDSDGRPVQNAEAVAAKERLLDEIGSLHGIFPDGPLDMVLRHFGHDQVAEVTGRRSRIVSKPDKAGVIRAVEETRGGKANEAETTAFQNGKKKILIFSDAGGTGRSYHADISSPSADARRSHYLVQAGWRADNAIQGFGRTHRANEASQPIFHLVTTDLQGQRRFISSIARRLAQLGALTKGERRAGNQGVFNARDNLESREARYALRQLLVDIFNNKTPGIGLKDFEEQTGLRLTDRDGSFRKDPPEIEQFLNRLLSLKIDMQNHVFGEFERRLDGAIEAAAAAGALDVGTETFRADQIHKAEERTVFTDPRTSAETKYVRIAALHANHPVDFDTLMSGNSRVTVGRVPDFFVESARSGKLLGVSQTTASHTDPRTGLVSPMYRLSDPLQYQLFPTHHIDHGANWKRIDDMAAARAAWERQVAAIPSHRQEDVHLITGAVLPIWDRLQGTPRIYRMQTDAGEALLGRVIPDDQIAHTLQALGVEGEERQHAPSAVLQGIMDGKTAALVNGWSLRRVMVSGEPRIELRGPDYRHRTALERDGAFVERIGYETRFFVPTGERAEEVLSRIVADHPVASLSGGRPELAEGEPGTPETARSAFASRDMIEDYRAYRAGTPYAEGPAGEHLSARDYVRSRGQDSGHEHMAIYDTAAGQVEHAVTSGLRDRVHINTPELEPRLLDPTSAMVIHHNHPGDQALSGSDLLALSYPGVESVVAHGHGEGIFSASLTPDARLAAATRGSAKVYEALAIAHRKAAEVVRTALQMQVLAGKIAPEQAEALHADLINRALDAAGLIDYVSTRSADALAERVRNSVIARAAGEAADNANFRIGVPKPTDQEIRDRVADRSTVAVRPDEAMARFSGVAGPRGPEGLTGAGAPQGGRAGIGAAPEGNEAMVGRGLGLAEDPERYGEGARIAPEGKDYLDAASEELARETGGGPPGTYARTSMRQPAGAAALAHKTRFFNALDRDFTMPANLARDDWRSAQKWGAEETRRAAATTNVHSYRDALPTWMSATPAELGTLNKAIELYRLKDEVPHLDGRAMVVENDGKVRAALTKRGERVYLDTPRLVAMAQELHGTFYKAWSNIIEASARQAGWHGEPTSEAIRRAEEATVSAREKREYGRLAEYVEALEEQRRKGYMAPLMRHGDYYLAIKPIAGTEGARREGWDGDGFPPVASFHLVDSRTPLEHAVGKIVREGETPKAVADKIAELRAQFPEGMYSIEHGYMFRKADAFRDIGIPAIEKLMMLIGNDVRSKIREAAKVSADPMVRRAVEAKTKEFYDEMVDVVRDQMYEELKAGAKRKSRNTPGYSTDFARSTSIYVNWAGHHVADLMNRESIERADNIVAQHPDPHVRDFWKRWNERDDRPLTALDTAFVKARQAAFMWTLGLNAASTAKILLHGPMLGVPTMTTGLGGTGRAMAAAHYAKAFGEMARTLRIGKGGIESDPSAARGLSAGERTFIKTIEAEGRLHPAGADELAAIRRAGEDALTPQQKLSRRVFDIWASNISASDRMLRGAMALATYRAALRPGMLDRFAQAWSRDEVFRDMVQRNGGTVSPELLGRFMIDRTMGIPGDVNRMPIARGQIGGVVMQFHYYELNYLSTLNQLMRKMGPEGKVSAALMVGGLAALGGLWALPFSQDIKKAAEWAASWVSDAEPDLDAAMANAMQALGYDRTTSEAALHGMGRNLLGIDLGSGIGFGEILSGRGQSAGANLVDRMASVSIFGGALSRAWQRHASGQGDAAVMSELLPTPFKNALRGSVIYPSQGVVTARGAQVLTPEKIEPGAEAIATAGFQPAQVSRAYEERAREAQMHAHATAQSAAIDHRIAMLRYRTLLAARQGDAATAAMLRQQEVDEIRQSVANGVRPNEQAIRRGLEQHLAPAAAQLRALPRVARPEALQSPYVPPIAPGGAATP